MLKAMKRKVMKAKRAEAYQSQSQFKDVWYRLRKNKLAMTGLIIVVVIVLAAIFADVITPYEYDKQDLRARFTYPCLEHLLGTDNLGRDILTRIIYGARTSLLVSLVAVAIGLLIGGSIGAIVSFYGGKLEEVVMRCLDVLMSIPPLILAVAISASLGVGKFNCAVAIGVSSIPSFARIIRSSVLSIKDQEYIEAATACGVSKLKTVFTHVIPNSLAPIMVQGTLKIGDAIMMISSLSFIGLGVQPPTPEWGSMLAFGRDYIREFWPIVTFPGLAIMVTLIAFNVLGDGLRDAMDPRLKQ